MRRSVVPVIVVLAAAFLLTLDARRGPTPQPASAPPQSFSSARAITTLTAILGGNTPHPLGTAAHEEVRQRVVTTLRSLGYEVEIEHSFACSPRNVCAPVANVLAHQKGRTSARSVILTAHYDSVGAGPGASDDGVGTAVILEIARALQNEHARNPISFLITDGEEAGLLGAEAFAASRKLTDSGVFVNVENRGTKGPSFLFETSRGNEWLIDAARSMPRPEMSSLFYSIYELMPNDTDLTVFKRAGAAGVGFAGIGGVWRYHTPLDNLANLDPRLTQQHGENILALTRSLANRDLGAPTGGRNATWFDVFSRFLVFWPEPWSLPATVVVLLILLAAAFRRRREERHIAAIGLGLASFVLTIAVAGMVGLLSARLTTWHSDGAQWVAHPGFAIAAMWLIGAGSAWAVADGFRRIGFDNFLVSYGFGWCLLALLAGRFLSGGSYLFLLPAAAFALMSLIRSFVAFGEGWIAAKCSFISATVLFILGLTFYDALGSSVLPGIAILIALVATGSALLVPGRASWLTAFAAAGICTIVAMLQPAVTPDHPRRLSIRYVQDGGATRWEVPFLSTAIRRAGTFSAIGHTPYQWYGTGADGFSAPASSGPLAPPRVEQSESLLNGARHVTLRLRSMRGASRVALMFHSGDTIDSLLIDGVAPARPSRPMVSYLAPGWHQVSVRASEAVVTFVDHGNAPIEVVATDTSYGLPTEGAALMRARDQSEAVATDDGDVTIVIARQEAAAPTA